MPNPSPDFSGYTPSQMQKLLDAEKRDRAAKDERWVQGHIFLFLLCIAAVVWGLFETLSLIFRF